jgi:alkane 1-monooxygenase
MGLYLLFGVVLDNWFGKNFDICEKVGSQNRQRFLNFCLFVSVPLHIILFFCVLSQLDSIPSDDWWSWGSVMVTFGLLNAFVGVVVGHEMIHGRGSWVFSIGQLCVAFSMHSSLAIDHLYGHHINVGLKSDNVTARRDEGFWRYFPRAIAGVNRSAFNFERKRLTRKQRSIWSLANRALFGYLLVIVLAAIAFQLGNWSGLAFYLVSAGIGMIVIEAGNYVGHYGLVRAPGEPVLARHSWNNFNTVSTSFMYNLPRHSDHHMRADTDYWELRNMADAPVYPYGYGTMTALAFVPKLFFGAVEEEIDRWNAELASPAELTLICNDQLTQ